MFDIFLVCSRQYIYAETEKTFNTDRAAYKNSCAIHKMLVADLVFWFLFALCLLLICYYGYPDKTDITCHCMSRK